MSVYEEYYAVANLPTLCEITYDQGEIYVHDERNIHTPYRCRLFDGAGMGEFGPMGAGAAAAILKIPLGIGKERDAYTSLSQYQDPVTIGRRSPQQVQVR